MNCCQEMEKMIEESNRLYFELGGEAGEQERRSTWMLDDYRNCEYSTLRRKMARHECE